MNKTVNVNLGGFNFYIDEDAYTKLSNYFDAIKRSLLNSEGHDEIVKDIEIRVAELFTETLKDNNQVVNLSNVDTIISIMGQPEDYIIEEDLPKSNYSQKSYSKKLYRDKDAAELGGVASGLGYYFGIDLVWIRVVLILLTIGGFGIGIIAYIILWVVTPVASTTSEKLEMKGEPINLSNIEKKVREEFANVSSKFHNGDYDNLGNKISNNTSKIGSRLMDVILTIFKIFAKFLGVILAIAGLVVLILLIISFSTLGSTGFIDLPLLNFIEAVNFSNYPLWSIAIVLLLALGIPFLFLIILGFKLLSPSIKSIGNTVKYTLLSLWIIATILVVTIAIKQVNVFSNTGRVVNKHSLNCMPTDTLNIQFKYNPRYSNGFNESTNFKITQDSLNKDILYSNEVVLKIEQTNEAQPYLQITKESSGYSIGEAEKTAERINYYFTNNNNNLVFDNYLSTALKNKFKNQKVEIYLFLPKNSFVKLDSNAQYYINDDSFSFKINDTQNHYLIKMKEQGLECLNCIDEDDNFDNKNTTVTINKVGIKVTRDTLNSDEIKSGELKVNSDGIIIKIK